MAAFWPIGTVQIIRIVSYPNRKKARFWLFCMWPVKDMYYALLPKTDYRDKRRGHDRRLRYLCSDESSQTSTLCDRIGYSLVDRRIQNLLIIVFKTINNYPPEYLRDLFRLRDNIKNLRGVNKLQVPKPNTTRYGKNPVKYLAAIT